MSGCANKELACLGKSLKFVGISGSVAGIFFASFQNIC